MRLRIERGPKNDKQSLLRQKLELAKKEEQLSLDYQKLVSQCRSILKNYANGFELIHPINGKYITDEVIDTLDFTSLYWLIQFYQDRADEQIGELSNG